MLCGRRADELLADAIGKSVRQQLLAHLGAQLGALLSVLVGVVEAAQAQIQQRLVAQVALDKKLLGHTLANRKVVVSTCLWGGRLHTRLTKSKAASPSSS